MSQSAVFRSARNSSVWSRLPVTYKLWLGIFWVPLLGLSLPTLVFLPFMLENEEQDFQQKWEAKILQICRSQLLLQHILQQDDLNQFWQGLDHENVVGLHLGFVSEDRAANAPADSSGSNTEIVSMTDSPLAWSPDDSVEAADPDIQTPFAIAAENPEAAADLSSSVQEVDEDPLAEFNKTTQVPSRTFTFEDRNEWLASIGPGRPDARPGQWLREELGDLTFAKDWQLTTLPNDSHGRQVIRAYSARLSDGLPLRTITDQNAAVVMVFVITRAELSATQGRIKLMSWGLVVLGAALLLPVTHLFLKMLVVGPVQSLARTMRSTKPENLGELQVPITRHDEIGELQFALNFLAAEISAKQKELNRYNDELEARVHERTAELERANRELDAFAYTVSHDLQAPLRNVSYIVGDELPEAIRLGQLNQTDELIGEVKRLCDFNIKMVRGLLDWARIGRDSTTVETVRLAEVLQDVKSGLRTQLEEKAVAVHNSTTLPVVQGDQMQLHRILTNLISNAVRYNDKPEKRIEVGWQSDTPHGPAMYVRDNGIGIKPQHIGRLFSLLVQLHDRRQFGEGVGMGLAIVKRIVDSYNGKIWAESVHGEGTTFWFTLPTLVTAEMNSP